jgi:MFS family permease
MPPIRTIGAHSDTRSHSSEKAKWLLVPLALVALTCAAQLCLGYARTRRSIGTASNLALHKVGARIWMCRMTVTCVLVPSTTMLLQGPTGFQVLRLVLGACEAGFFLGVLLYLYLFPDARRDKAMGLFYFGAPLGFMFGAPLRLPVALRGHPSPARLSVDVHA